MGKFLDIFLAEATAQLNETNYRVPANSSTHVRMTDHQSKELHGVKDGETHEVSSIVTHHKSHYIEHQNPGKRYDQGTDHKVAAKRVGDIIHLHDKHKGTHITSIHRDNLPEKSHLGESVDLTEARLVKTHTDGNRTAKVYKDTEYGEHVVKFHTDGKHHKDADYHTDDAEDAHGTAKHWISQKNESIEKMVENNLSRLARAKGHMDGRKHTLDDAPEVDHTKEPKIDSPLSRALSALGKEHEAREKAKAAKAA